MRDAIGDDLGLPAASSLDAQVLSMLLYEPGQFFAAHQGIACPEQTVIAAHAGETVRHALQLSGRYATR